MSEVHAFALTREPAPVGALARAHASAPLVPPWNPFSGEHPFPDMAQRAPASRHAAAATLSQHNALESEPVAVTETGELLEPKWPDSFRGSVARLLWRRGNLLIEGGKAREGKSLQKKALRFLNCNKCARPGRCSLEPASHRYYIPNGCEVVFCKQCADELRRELFSAYLLVILAVITKLGGIPKGWTLARITVTLRSDGKEITPERVKQFNAAVRALARKVAGRDYGMLFADEVGFETRGHLPDHLRKTHGLNLHAHGLYLGPLVKWNRWRDEWMKVSQRRFGEPSRGFYITAVKIRQGDVEGAVRWALHHMFKYVSKPPAISPERLAALIGAFHTAKRIHALGSFAGRKPNPPKRDIPCPKCRALHQPGVICFEGRDLPNGGRIPAIRRIEELEADGYLPLRSFRAFDGAARDVAVSAESERGSP